MLTRAVVTHKVCGFALWSGELRMKSEKPRESTDVGEKVVLSFGCTGCGEATRSVTGSTQLDMQFHPKCLKIQAARCYPV